MSERPSHVGILAMEVYLPGQKVWAMHTGQGRAGLNLQCNGLPTGRWGCLRAA